MVDLTKVDFSYIKQDEEEQTTIIGSESDVSKLRAEAEAKRRERRKKVEESGGRMILLHRHSIATTIQDRYATSVYSFDFENINDEGSNELKFEITIDTEAFISKFEADIDGEKFIGNTKEKETAAKEYSEAKEKNENAILISKPYDDIPNVFQIKTNIDSKSKISLDITIEQYIPKQFNVNQLNIQILRNFTKYNIKPNFDYISFKVDITDRSGIYDVNVMCVLDHTVMDKLNQHYTAEGKIMKQNAINELLIRYKVKGEQNECTLLYDAKSHTFCHIISDIITDSVITNEQDTNEGDTENSNVLIPRRVVFVIDQSGSMSGGKWTKAILATTTAINKLRKGYDRYCILFFNSNVTCVPTDGVVLAKDDNLSETISVLQGASAGGGTDINTALLQAIERIKEDIKTCHDAPHDGNNFYMNQILFLTDGEPNSGESNPHQIISNVKEANHLKDIDPYMSKISIFSFGVGTDGNDSSWIKDLNHSFLKLLSVNNNGFYQRIKSSQTDTALTAYFDILSTPVLFNIGVKYNHKNVEQLSNTTFHTLYAGNDIIICGKMDAGDEKELCLDSTITATTAKEMRTADGDRCIAKPVNICKQMKVNIEVGTHDDNHIGRIWAYLKLQEFAKKKLIYNDLIEVSDDEKRDDDALPLSLAMEYKFVTPWTSMIVVKKKEEEIPKVPVPPLNQEKKVLQREERDHMRMKREASIKAKRSNRKRKEATRRDKEEEAYIKKNFSEMCDYSDEDCDTASGSSDFSSDSDNAPISIKERLKNFDKIAATGQLFLKFGANKRRKPQDRIVKVTFDNKYKPIQISWGSGSHHIDFSEILYIAWGHWTPVFEARKDQIDPKLCFSVVGKHQILDVQAQSKEMAELWVKGLRKLIGHSDEKSDKLAKQAVESGSLHKRNEDN